MPREATGSLDIRAWAQGVRQDIEHLREWLRTLGNAALGHLTDKQALEGRVASLMQEREHLRARLETRAQHQSTPFWGSVPTGAGRSAASAGQSDTPAAGRSAESARAQCDAVLAAERVCKETLEAVQAECARLQAHERLPRANADLTGSSTGAGRHNCEVGGDQEPLVKAQSEGCRLMLHAAAFLACYAELVWDLVTCSEQVTQATFACTALCRESVAEEDDTEGSEAVMDDDTVWALTDEVTICGFLLDQQTNAQRSAAAGDPAAADPDHHTAFVAALHLSTQLLSTGLNAVTDDCARVMARGGAAGRDSRTEQLPGCSTPGTRSTGLLRSQVGTPRNSSAVDVAAGSALHSAGAAAVPMLVPLVRDCGAELQALLSSAGGAVSDAESLRQALGSAGGEAWGGTGSEAATLVTGRPASARSGTGKRSALAALCRLVSALRGHRTVVLAYLLDRGAVVPAPRTGPVGPWPRIADEMESLLADDRADGEGDMVRTTVVFWTRFDLAVWRCQIPWHDDLASLSLTHPELQS